MVYQNYAATDAPKEIWIAPFNGYDHYTPEEEAEMFGLQEEILTAYGLTRQ